jgi:hypothetical protein
MSISVVAGVPIVEVLELVDIFEFGEENFENGRSG